MKRENPKTDNLQKVQKINEIYFGKGK